MTQDNAEFIADAKRVRDYGIRAGCLPDDDLIDALLPFDANPKESDPVKIAKLRRAARKAYATMDEVTLDAVFREKDPTRVREERKGAEWWRIVDFRSRPGNLVILIGFVILLFAFHYTNWTQRVETTLRKASDLSQVDYLYEMRRMIEIGRQIEELREPPYTRPDIASADVATFLSSTEKLQSFNLSHRALLTEALLLDEIYAPSEALLSFLPDHVRSLPRRMGAQYVEWWSRIGEWWSPEEQASEPPQHARPSAAPPTAMERWQRACVEDPRDEFYVFAQYRCYVASEAYINWSIGVDMPPAGFVSEKAAMDTLRETLKFKANTANSWILPAIYGALGAAVYSVVRYINIFLADPPLRTSLLRIAFGSFTGITLSMLFGPSSIVTMAEFQTSTTLFLVCFLFGYSLDSFLALLRRADSYVNSAFSGPQR